MRTITIIEGVTLTATENTIRTYEAEKADHEAAIEWEENAHRWLREAAEAGDWSLYSDLHKDIYGVRPWRLGAKREF